MQIDENEEHDVSDLKQQIANLLQQVDVLKMELRYDELTGLLSRRAFYNHYESYASAGDVLLFIDIDDFKSVNDGYGFSTGDELLSKIGSKILEKVADRGEVARLAGDEFLVLLEKEHAEQAQEICDDIHFAISKSAVVSRDLSVARSASIGFASITKGMLAREAIEKANIGLRIAKNSGKSQAKEAYERRDISSPLRPTIEDVRRGLQREEIGYHLQPLLDLKHSKVWGYEALLRWQRDDGQVLGPIHFLETMTKAYDAETRPPLKAAHKAADWVANKQGKRISFNISTAFLDSVGARGMEWVNEIVGDIAYDRVIFELVETIVATDRDSLALTVCMLRELGVKIAIDDFGVGQSTLSRLQSIPVDYVKIDKQFIKNATRSERDRAILASMVNLTHASGAECIVEGIETPEMLSIAAQAGAHIGQGFFLGKPNPAEFWENNLR